MSSIGYLSQNGVNRMFNQWVDSDPNLIQYGFGQLYNENGQSKAQQSYPGVWVNPVNTTSEQYAITRTYQILFYDVPFISGSASNENAVISDCEEYAFRLVRFLRLKSDLFNINGTPNITPFTDKFLDDVSGVILDVSIDFNAESSDCEDPDYNFGIQNNEI